MLVFKKLTIALGVIGLMAYATPWVEAGDMPRLLREGQQFYQHQEYDKALGVFQKALQMDSENPEVNYNAGVAAYRSEQYLDAAPYFRKALLTDDDAFRMQAGYNLGNTLFALGQTVESEDADEARAHYEEALRHFESVDSSSSFYVDAKHNAQVVKQALDVLNRKSALEQDSNSQDSKDSQASKDSQDSKDSQNGKGDQQDQQQGDSSESQNQYQEASSETSEQAGQSGESKEQSDSSQGQEGSEGNQDNPAEDQSESRGMSGEQSAEQDLQQGAAGSESDNSQEENSGEDGGAQGQSDESEEEQEGATAGDDSDEDDTQEGDSGVTTNSQKNKPGGNVTGGKQFSLDELTPQEARMLLNEFQTRENPRGLLNFYRSSGDVPARGYKDW